jgi:hypothetical protein
MTRPGFRPLSPMLPPEAHARINAELQTGERLLWEGQPIPGLYARSGLPIAIFGVLFGGFAVFWMLVAGGMMWFTGDRPRGADAPGFFGIFNCFPLFGIPFLLIGLGMILAPVWMRRAAARTVYGVTDRRVIICKGRPFGGVEVRSFGPAELTELTRIERANGAGDLIFREVWNDSLHTSRHRTPARTQIGFIAVERVREIEELVRRELVDPQKNEPRP